MLAKINAVTSAVTATLPPMLRSFLKRALFIFIAWKLLYHVLLLPYRMPDHQLTTLTATTTGVLYKGLFNQPVNFEEEAVEGSTRAIVYISDKRAIGIADSCNGLELFVLYLAFLWCFPIAIKKQLTYAITGVVAIFILNAFRCVGLAWLYLHNYAIADFAHHYLFKMVIYSLIFLSWVKYTRKYFSNDNK